MRYHKRQDVPERARKYLVRKQAEVDGGADARQTWDSARRTKSMREVAKVLRSIVGRRNRCMYCEDSRATDIDHYRPLAHFRGHTFQWLNHLWICADCNRTKGDSFDLATDGSPLLLDPTVDEPWKFLYYDSHTDIITARFDTPTGEYNVRGSYTCRPDILPLNVEPVTEGRGRIRRNLARAVRTFLHAIDNGDDVMNTEVALREALYDNDGYGLLDWYVHYDGVVEEPFAKLRQRFPGLLERLHPLFTPP